MTIAGPSPTKGLYDHCRSDDLDLHSRSEVRLKLHYFSTYNISDNIEAIAFKLGRTVDLCMALKLTLTLKTFLRLVLLVSFLFLFFPTSLVSVVESCPVFF